MHYIVLDLEWNKALSRHKRVHYPITLNGEIIQIGAVKLDENLKEVDDFNCMVKPQFYTKMHKDIEQITSIHDEDLQKGMPFPEAAEAFRQWCGDDCILLSWGPCDIDMLIDNLIMHNMDTSWIPEPFDAQLMFDDLETMADRCFSLDYAVVYFRIKGNKGHDALNDARDTAAVIRNMDVATWIEEERAYRMEQELLERVC